MNFSILGTGSALPVCIKTNEDLSKIVDTNDEWISTRTGIKERRICGEQPLSEIASIAANNALENAGIKADELDLIICATISGDYITPSLACIIQSKIKATCPAFDVSAACTGFIYALDVAAGYFARGKFKKILIVAADAMSKLIDWKDRATCVLFGDAASAVVLTAGDDLLSIKLTATGDPTALNAPNVTGNCPFGQMPETKPYMSMNGQEIYKFAVSAMCNDITDVINEAGLTKDQIDYILPHQANIRIIEAAQKRLKMAKDKYLTNIKSYGNTSAVSIPLLLDDANRSGKFKKGDLLALSAFGAGLTTGACVIRWNK